MCKSGILRMSSRLEKHFVWPLTWTHGWENILFDLWPWTWHWSLMWHKLHKNCFNSVIIYGKRFYLTDRVAIACIIFLVCSNVNFECILKSKSFGRSRFSVETGFPYFVRKVLQVVLNWQRNKSVWVEKLQLKKKLFKPFFSSLTVTFPSNSLGMALTSINVALMMTLNACK